MPLVSKDTPLAEITLRKYEKPYESDNKRDIIRKLCLSLGLLQPGNSRDVIVDVLQLLLESKNELESEEIVSGVISLRKEAKLPLQGIASSNIRRQVKRLKDIYLVEKVDEDYRISENESLQAIFEQKIEKFYLQSIVSRVKEYCQAVSKVK